MTFEYILVVENETFTINKSLVNFYLCDLLTFDIEEQNFDILLSLPNTTTKNKDLIIIECSYTMLYSRLRVSSNQPPASFYVYRVEHFDSVMSNSIHISVHSKENEHGTAHRATSNKISSTVHVR